MTMEQTDPTTIDRRGNGTATGQTLLAMVANNTANLRRNSVELKEVLVTLQQQVNDLSEQVVFLTAQVHDLSGQLAMLQRHANGSTPMGSHASLAPAVGDLAVPYSQETEEHESPRRASKQPRVRYYRHDSGPPEFASPRREIGDANGMGS